MAKRKKGEAPKPNAAQVANGEVLYVQFVKDYRKPMNVGGRLIRKGQAYFMTVEKATKYCKDLKVAKIMTEWVEPNVAEAREKKEGAPEEQPKDD